MSANEVDVLNEKLDRIMARVELISKSLVTCQSRCHVDNTPGKWTGLWRSVKNLFKK